MCLFKLFGRRKKAVSEPEATERSVENVRDGTGETLPEYPPVEEEKPAFAANVAVEEQKQVVAGRSAEERPSAVGKDNGKILVRVRYNRSFTAKLIQSDDKIKSYYGEIRNGLMRYKVKSRISWRYETFRTGRKLLARISVRGKTLSLYLALDPKAYDGTKYKIDDVSSVSNSASVPTLYKIKNDRRCRYAKDLISALMAENGLEPVENPMEDYCAKYPYEELEPLIARKLVKLLKREEKSAGSEEGLIEISEEQYGRLTAETSYSEVAAAKEAPLEEEFIEQPVEQPFKEAVTEEASEEQLSYPEIVESITVIEAEEKIADEVAKTFIRESARLSDRTKKTIVNIDTLGRYFGAGETVTIEEIKKRVPAVDKKATYIKVLARGTLDKALNIEADDFSPSAVKMIVLTGGTVSRTKTRN